MNSTPPPNTVDAFRQRVCDEALRLFELDGYAGISMRRIAIGCRCSPMKAYRYFTSKTDIVAALRVQAVEMLRARLQRAVALGGDPVDRFVRMGEAYVGFAHEAPGYYRVLFELPREFAGDPVPVEESPPFLLLVELMRELSDRFDGDPMANAYAVWSALHGLVLNDLAGVFESDHYSFEVLWQRAVEILLRGMERRR